MMKKTIVLIITVLASMPSIAQDLTSKKGEPILPEAGDYAISVDATPFLNYIGNFFGKTAANAAPSWNYFTANQTIIGKYFKDAKTAYRVGIRLGFGGPTVTNKVNQANSPIYAYPDITAKVENSWKQSNTNVGITVGFEKRKGKTRLQGFYGADVALNIYGKKSTFTYGNALVPVQTGTLNVVGVSPSDSIAGANNISSTTGIVGIIGNARAVSMKSGVGVQFGIRAFVGAEYFILPKISIGGEFGWGIGVDAGGRKKTEWESIGKSGSNNLAVGITPIAEGKTTTFVIDNDKKSNTGGSIFGATGNLRLTFHF